ncbi:ankyrin repeat-containing domain protein [Xylaria acuta]|nr:ankyrin repeat-containing domain protein [Xylaria acuta]
MTVICEECGRICKSSTDRSQHKRCHIRKFPCMKESCLRKAIQVGFSTKRDLTRHQEQVHSKKRTQCPYCSKSLKRQDNLGRHIAKLHGEELLVTATGEDEAIIRLVLGKGTNIESKRGDKRQTLLSLAAENSQEAVVKLLLGKGADIESKNVDGYTPLGLAALRGHAAVVELLLSKGANTESKGYWDNRLLCFAASGGHIAVVE